MDRRVRHRLRDRRQRQPNTCTGKSPNQKIVSREKGMKRDIQMPRKLHFLQGSEGARYLHLHFDFWHWLHAENNYKYTNHVL